MLSGPQLTRQIQRAEASQQVVRLVQQAGPLCNAFHFSTAVNRIARLEQQEQSASNHSAFAALLAFAEQHPPMLDHVAVVQAVYAGGVLQYSLTAEQQAAWQGRLAWAFGQRELKPNELSNGLWGWSKMGLPLRGQLAAAANVAMLQLAAEMKSQEVSNTLVAHANAGWQLDSTAAAAAALLQRLEQVPPHAKPQEVANSLWAAAKLGLQLSDSLKAALLQRLEQVLPEAVPQHVANSLWAAAKLGLQLSGSLKAVLLQRLEQVLPLAKPQEVANSLWAIAKLGLRLSSSLKAAFKEALWRIIPAAKSQNLANISLACGTLRWSPGGRILAAAVAAMLRRLATEPNMAAQAIKNFLWGLAKLQEQGVKPPGELYALLSAAADWAGSRWGQLSAFDVVDLCFNLARLGHQPASDWIAAAVTRCGCACVQCSSTCLASCECMHVCIGGPALKLAAQRPQVPGVHWGKGCCGSPFHNLSLGVQQLGPPAAAQRAGAAGACRS